MIESQNLKVQTILTGAAVATDATALSDVVDTRGFGHAVFCISVAKPTAGGTSTITSIVLLEGTNTSPTTEVGVFKGFSAATSITGGGFLIGTSNNTAVPYEFVWNVDLSKRAPYLAVRVQAAAGYTSVGAKCILLSPEISPAVATDVGNANWVVG